MGNLTYNYDKWYCKSLYSSPVEQYPDIVPPQININASYSGADAKTVENSVTQIIEQQLTGLDGMLYFSSSSSSTETLE